MVWQRVPLLLMAAQSFFGTSAQAEEKEPSAIIELGGAGEWGIPGSSSFGPSAAVEFTPIKDWLEIEAGVAPLFSGGRTEWDTDLLFKKPFTLSDKVEFMIGAGPQLTFSPEGTKSVLNWRPTLCSGQPRIASMVGFWSRPTATRSAAGTNNRLV